MKNVKIVRLVPAIFIVASLLCIQPVFADVTGSGSLSFTFDGAMPDLVQFIPHATVADSPGSYTYGTTSVTNGHSSASVTLGGPEYPAYISPVTNIGTTSFNFDAQKLSAATMGSAEVDVQGYFLYGGWNNGFGYGDNILTLPKISYTYNFNGSADATDDQMVFRVQFEISNDINGDDSHPLEYLYSDYNPSAPAFRSKMPEFIYKGVGSQISGTGTVEFGPFTEQVPHTWYIWWDLEGYIADYAEGDATNSNSVPEPATMLLLGLGLAGLAGVRKKL